MKLSELKKQLNILAEITENREKIETEKLYGQTLTIDEYVIVKESNGEFYAVAHAKELPNNFHFAGSIESEILATIDCDEELKAEFEQTGVKLKFEMAKSKNNRNYTKVTMI